MNVQLLKQVAKDEQESLKKSFDANPLLLKALRSFLDGKQKEVVLYLSSAELLNSVNYQESISSLLAELRTYRQLREVLN